MKFRMWKNKHQFIRPLEQERAEKLAEIGSKLRMERQALSISLEEVAAKTRIQRRQLQAIEDAQLDELPEPVYIQSFIRQYADVLGLNGIALSGAFPTGDRNRVFAKPAWKGLPIAQLRPIHLYLLYVLMIICAVNSLSNVLTRAELQASNGLQQKSRVQSPTKVNKAIVKPLDKLKPASNAVEGTKVSKSVRVGVTLKAQSWLRVVADGKMEFEGVLPEGTQRTWIAEEKLVVRAGNAGGVLVAFNDQQAKELGAPGAVKEVIYDHSNGASGQF